MKMQEKKLKRFNVYSKIANVLFILNIILGVFVIAVSLTGGLYLALSDFDVSAFGNRLLVEYAPEIGLVLPDFNISAGMIIMIVLSIALDFALIAYIFKSVSNLFKNITANKTPFNQKTVNGIKNIGIALFVYTGIVFIFSLLMGTIIPHVVGTTMNVSVKWAPLLYGLLLLSLGEIFEFGMNLQQDNESIV